MKRPFRLLPLISLLLASCVGSQSAFSPTEPAVARPSPTISLTTAPVEELGQPIYAVETFATGIGFPLGN